MLASEALQLVRLAMPAELRVDVEPAKSPTGDVLLNLPGRRTLRGRMADGDLASANAAISTRPRPDFLVLPHASPGVRAVLQEHRIGWLDAQGEVHLVSGSVVIVRDAPASAAVVRTATRWTAADVITAQALLTGSPGTVEAVISATGLSRGSVTLSLRHLAGWGLLESKAARGRNSRRTVVSADKLLSAYARAANDLRGNLSVRVAVGWRNPVDGIAEAGRHWTKADVQWAATSALAASVLAPLATSIAPIEAYVAASTPAALTAAAAAAGLSLDRGGRLVLRPFPRLARPEAIDSSGEIPVMPWPRVYADLQQSGVRNEEAAEHLKEQMMHRQEIAT